MEIYACYNTVTGEVLALHFGCFTPDTTPFVLISQADYTMALSHPERFKVVGNNLIPLENPLYYLRIKRDYLLKESDKFMLPDYPIKDITREEWLSQAETYRQALRDFPITVDLKDPVFPTPPGS